MHVYKGIPFSRKPDVIHRAPPEPLGSESSLQRYHGVYIFRLKSDGPSMQSRQQIRRSMRQQRAQLSAIQKLAAAKAMAKIMLATGKLQRAQRIAFYMPVGGEIDCHLLLAYARRLKKKCFLPVLHPLQHTSLWFAEYSNNKNLIRNRYGILEPNLKKCCVIPAWTLDLVFVPLVAFDKKGNRLGMGKGYYDRSFAFTKKRMRKPLLIGLAYEFQRCANISVESWDVALTAIVTEQNYYARHSA